MKTFKYLSENKQEINKKLCGYLINNPMTIRDLSIKIGVSRFVLDSFFKEKKIAIISLFKIYKFLEEH